jgi:hypothetical protein
MLRLVSDAPDVEKLDTATTAAAAEKAQGHVGCSFVLGDALEKQVGSILTLRKSKAWKDLNMQAEDMRSRQGQHRLPDKDFASGQTSCGCKR